MKSLKIISAVPNYRKKALQIVLRKGSTNHSYELPFSAFKGLNISVKNPFTEIEIEKDLSSHSARFVLKNGKKGDFPADFVLYHCDPEYDWSAINQLKNAIKERLNEAKISVRLLAKALRTSPSQVERLLSANGASKQLIQLCRAAEIAGYNLEFKLKEKKGE